MCKFKSAIILKDRVFIPDYDHHQEMLKALNIADTKENAERLFVRAELIPKNQDVFSNIEDWEFVVDQDIIPEWFVAEYEKQRMIEAVKGWAKSHIHIGIDGLEISEGTSHYIKDCKNVTIRDSASVENICGSASVKNIYGSASVENICDSASVENICDSASVKYIYGSASVENIYGSASVENIYGSASVKYIYGSASVKVAKGNSTIVTSQYFKWRCQEKLILLENSTLKDNYSRVIYQSGDYKLVAVKDGKVG